MIDKTFILDQFRHETACIIHIASKLDAGNLDWRPTPAQRSTIELLRYIALTGVGPLRFFLDGKWDFWETREEELKSMQLSGFAAAMQRQLADIEALLAPMTAHDLAQRKVTDWFGRAQDLDQAISRFSLTFLSTYKMQLFLYAKQGGATIGSSNLWMGVDPAPKAAAAG
jgi:hypothetical protein